MSRRIYTFSMIVMLTCLLTACWDDNDPMDATPSADLLRTNEVTLEAEATEGVIPMETNCSWTATTQSDWLTLSTHQGHGIGDLRLTTTHNTWSEERTAIVTLTTQGGIRRNLTIRQLGSDARMQVTPISMTFPALESTSAFTISSNVKWTIRTEQEWLTAFSADSGSGDADITFHCNDNYTVQSRTGKILVEAEGFPIKAEINVMQAAGVLPVVGELQWLNQVELQFTMKCLHVSSMFPITEYGICYAQTAAPTTADQKAATVSDITPLTDVPSQGTFTAILTDLTEGATYHARAYAISPVGTAYGSTLTFDALAMPGNGDNIRPNFIRKKS
ncbi:MAG: BACON domain-containing protein [Bacteroidaceae bacterium]|nr:BACON domain-containing protein [Bacteroidaceae bacterium]